MAEWASVLVGRRAELAALETALADAGRGAPRAVALTGEPGIGKSRLLAEVAGRARERGLLVLEGRATELERDLPFALVEETLTTHELEDELASGDRHRVARAVRALLERRAAERPVALLLDDVHWADPASADVLALLLFRPPRGGVLLVLAARPRRAPALESALAGAQQRGAAQLIELGPLPFEAVDELLPGVGPAARERLHRESGGNPFYLQELARADGAVGASAGWTGVAGVPAAVQAALAGEVAALSPSARRVLEGAAVAGDPFEPGLAAVAAELDDAATLAGLDELAAADLVRPAPQPGRFRFRHPLVRRAVYEGAGGGWRLGAHARAADALAARGATPGQRAHHVERAARMGDLDAVDMLAAAADEVVGAAPASAAAWYEAALRLLPGSGERRLELLRGRAAALVSAGRAGDACAALRQVLALLPADAASERVETVVALAGLLAVWAQQPDEAGRVLAAERAAVGDVAPALRAALDLELASERAEYGDHAASEALADQASADASAAGDRALEAAAAARAADAAHCRLRGDDPDALAAVDAKIAAAGALVESLPEPEAATRLEMWLSLGIARAFTGRTADARVAAERGLALARATGQGLFAPAFVSLRALTDEQSGRLDAAEADLDEVLEGALLSGNVQVAFWARIAHSWIALARGDVDGALAHGEHARALLGTREYSQAGFTLADARLAAGDPPGALDALETFGWVRPQLWTLDRIRAAEVAVRVLLALGRVDEAAAWAARAPVEGGGRRTGVFGAIIAHAEAAVLLARGGAGEAARVALAGAAVATDAPVWGARCRTLAGEALLAAGRREDARRELRAAASTLESCGAWGYRDSAVRVLRRLGDRPRPAAAVAAGDGRLGALTAREREVAALMAGGQTNAQIAARLHLSESTVEKHVSRVLAKLGVSSRAAVVGLLARDLGVR